MPHQSLSATERAARSREATKAAIARELLYVGILARLWPSYVTDAVKPEQNPHLPYLLVVETPAGTIVWRLTAEEVAFFDHLPIRQNDGFQADDKIGVLYALAAEGWQ